MNQIIPFVTAHWPLCISLLLIVLLLVGNEWMSTKQHGKKLSPAQAIDLINHHDAVIFDLRPHATYVEGHIIHAMHVLESDIHLPKFEKYKTKPILLVCARGTQATQCAIKLRKLGFTRPVVLAGGIAAWQVEQLPLVKGKK